MRQMGRESLNFRQAMAKSEAQWRAFLQDLYQRGLEGATPHRICTL